MADNDQANAQADDIVFSARYSRFKVWISIIVAILPVMFLSFGAAYLCMLRGKYLGAVALSLIGSCGLLFVLDSALFKGIEFFGDRVTKLWYVFGSRTVQYSSGMAKAPDWYMRLLSSAHFIVEVKDDGRPVPLRLPIMYYAFFFPSDTAKKIEMIIDYLTEDTENNPRKFKRSMLPKEFMVQEP